MRAGLPDLLDQGFEFGGEFLFPEIGRRAVVRAQGDDDQVGLDVFHLFLEKGRLGEAVTIGPDDAEGVVDDAAAAVLQGDPVHLRVTLIVRAGVLGRPQDDAAARLRKLDAGNLDALGARPFQRPPRRDLPENAAGRVQDFEIVIIEAPIVVDD